MAIVFLILVTPEIVDAIALLIWFVRLGGPFSTGLAFINAGEVRLFVGHSLFSSAVVTLIVRARLQGLDESLEEAAGRPGRDAVTRLSPDHVAADVPGAARGALLAFTFSLDNRSCRPS